MKSFFHLSRCRHGKAIVGSLDERVRDVERYFSPRTPRDYAKEIPDKRTCIGPTVWQSLTGHPDTEVPLYIYSLRCFDAIPARKDEHRVGDADWTNEHWITDEVVSRNGGHIPLALEGVLRQPARFQHLIQEWRREPRNVSLDFSSIDEREHLWTIDAASAPRDWFLRLCWDQDPDDEPPLVPPSIQFG